MTVLRGELIPMYELNLQLGLRGQFEISSNYFPMVVVMLKGQKIGLIVDDYYNEIEYVIKPLPEGVKNVEGVSGAMITGDGRVHLILDIIRLI